MINLSRTKGHLLRIISLSSHPGPRRPLCPHICLKVDKCARGTGTTVRIILSPMGEQALFAPHCLQTSQRRRYTRVVIPAILPKTEVYPGGLSPLFSQRRKYTRVYIFRYSPKDGGIPGCKPHILPKTEVYPDGGINPLILPNPPKDGG